MLFEPLQIRDVSLRNRIVVSPMCQYSAKDGHVGDWHLVHLGKFAQGGAGVVFVEATAVEKRGRITHGDTGIWDDAHIPGLRRIAEFVKSQGAVPAPDWTEKLPDQMELELATPEDGSEEDVEMDDRAPEEEEEDAEDEE